MIAEQEFWRSHHLSFRVLEDIWAARQPSTVEKYCYALRSFFTYSIITTSDISLPVNVISAARYLSNLRERGTAKSSIKLALVSLKWINQFFPGTSGLNDPLKDGFLDRIVESAKRNMETKKNQKLPFSKDMIRDMLTLRKNPTLTELRDALIPSLSFMLLLRNDELIHLSCRHMTRTNQGVEFQIVSSKTDIYRKGKTLFLAEQTGENSVFSLLLNYMKEGGLKMGENKFLFGKIQTQKGRQCINGSENISYQICRDVIKEKVKKLGFNPDNYGTHSSRSGAATSLAPDVTEFELMVSGRWADARSLKNYVEINTNRRYEISRNLFL